MIDCARGEEDPALPMKNVVLEVAFKVSTISSDEMTSSIFLTCIIPFTLVINRVASHRIAQSLSWVILTGIRRSQVLKLKRLQLLMLLLYGLASLFNQSSGECESPLRFKSLSFGKCISLFLVLSFGLCDSTSNSHCYILLCLNSLIVLTILASFFNFGELLIIRSLANIGSDILYC